MKAPAPVSIALLSDFDTRNLAMALRAARPGVTAESGSYGQIAQHVLDAKDALWSKPVDVGVVWATPQHASPAFAAALAGERWTPAELDRDVDAHVALIARLVGRAGSVIAPTFTIDPRNRNRGLVTTRTGVGLHHALTRMNLRLMEACEKQPGVFAVPAEPWLLASPAAYSAKHWYLSKWPFTVDVAKAAAADILGAVDSLRGASKKLIVLDLDDTLWGGVLGEEGVEGVKLGGHEAQGEAFLEFQKALEALARTGILLAVVSKNDEALALDAIEKLPEMVLRKKAFAAWRINWDDKAKNIAAIADELSLGLDAVVFIDDNPAERDRVKGALPAVTVPDWPADKLLYAQTLRSLRLFDTPSISEEDRERTSQYAAERTRKTVLDEVGSVEEWIKSLEVRVEVSELDAASLARAAQLLNKTNQMNMATRRMSAAELLAWAEALGQSFYTVRAADRLGDYGLVGLLGVRVDAAQVELVDFVLSCRAMGRGVEEAMLQAVLELARKHQRPGLVARYLKTDRNAACLKKLLELAPSFDEATKTLSWQTSTMPAPFGGVRVSYPAPEAAAR